MISKTRLLYESTGRRKELYLDDCRNNETSLTLINEYSQWYFNNCLLYIGCLRIQE